VTNNAGNSVTVIDAVNDAVLVTGGTIDLSPSTGPEGITVTPDGTRAYVVNEGSDDVTVINLVNNTDDATPGPQPPAANTVVATITPTGTDPQGIDVTPDGLSAYFANLTTNNVEVIDTDPASGAFNTIIGSPVAVGTAPESEMGVAAVPYPVLHFTLAVDGGTGRRIMAQGDDDADYSDFIRVKGGVPPFTFLETTAALGAGACNQLGLTGGTGEISGTTPNPAGGGPQVANCDFTIEVTDSATVPQVISGDFRVVITED
jgi:DNA-binding beta-propeller fold protein YncE